MFPARDIANEFWAFVRSLALDPRNAVVDPTFCHRDLEPERTNSRTLDELEDRRVDVLVQLAGPTVEVNSAGSKTGIWRRHNDRQSPWGYRTVQGAMVAFLIDSAVLGKLTFDLGIWRCTVALILADAARDPSWLRVILRHVDDARAAEGDPGVGEDPLNDPQFQNEIVMTISDDWSCLSAETFDYIVRTYTGIG
jgi:hypothetical protein